MHTKKLNLCRIMLGADPEFFVVSADNKVINAEQVVVPKERKSKYTNIFADGIAVEINPIPSTCRETLGEEINYCLHGAYNEIKAREKNIGKKLGIKIGSTVEIDLNILEGATANAKQFLCAPSNSCYSDKKDQITIDASVHDKRYGGGHIHLGLSDYAQESGPVIAAFENPADTVKALDILVGSFAVLIDRDPANIIRRKLYGKPGEYRIPQLGQRIEYRVLSNFWLKSPVYMYFVFGLARMAVNTVGYGRHEELFGLVDFNLIQEAILENSFTKAWATVKEVLPWIRKTFKARESDIHALLRTETEQNIFKWFISYPEFDTLYNDSAGLFQRWQYAYNGWDSFCAARGRQSDNFVGNKSFSNWRPEHLEARLELEAG